MSGFELITNALGWTLLHSLWQISLLALLLYLVLLLCQRSDAQYRHGMAVLGLMLAAAVPAYTFMDIYLDRQDSAPAKESVSAQLPEEALFQLSEVIIEQATQAEADAWVQCRNWLNSNIYWISLFWLMGVLIFSLRFAGGLWYLHRLRSGNSSLPEEWQSKGKEIASLLEIKLPIQFLASVKVKAPVMIGVLKPVILLPVSLLTQLPAEQIEAILAHEIAHIYRKDYLVNLLQSVLEIIFFFHPALWWMSSVIKEEREKCCDDLAVLICGNSMAYVKALARVEEYRQNPRMALAMSGSGSGLLQRIERLLSPERSGNRLMARMLSGGIAIVLLTLLLSARQGAVYQEVKKQAEISSVYLKNLVPETWIEKRYLQEQKAATDAYEESMEEAEFALTESHSQDTLPAPKAPRVIVIKSDSLDEFVQHFSFNIDSLMNDLPKFNFDVRGDTAFSFSISAPDAPPSTRVYSFSAPHAPQAARAFSIISDSVSRVIRLNQLDSLFAFSMNGKLHETFGNIDTAYFFNFSQDMPSSISDPIIWAKKIEKAHLSRIYNSLNDSTLRARMLELEKEMRLKEKELQQLMEEQQELLQEQFEKQNRQMEEQQKVMEQEQEKMMKLQQKMQEKQQEMEPEQQQLEKNKTKLEKQLLKDGLIKTSNKYSFRISKGKLFINNERQSDQLYKKYIKFLNDELDMKLEEGDSYSISTEVENKQN